ncbi:hypothetical protein IWW39_000770 [Coemansia spiralis]|uniref:Uncharacterized protein n=1 Tax=Coemansia spiralis TaxID=417178 RepID=A0A9W8GP32_9FUNG|nr:hypothetical protein IWW39_000770 [Coemansia spiralis]
MFKITALAYALSMVAVQAYPIAEPVKRDIQFSQFPSQLMPSQQFPSQLMPSQPDQSQMMPSQQAPSQLMPSQQLPSQLMPSQPDQSQLMPSQQDQSQLMPSQQVPPQDMTQQLPAQPMAPAVVDNRPTSLSFNNDQDNKLKTTSVKDTTLYFNQKGADVTRKADKSDTQLNYSKS